VTGPSIVPLGRFQRLRDALSGFGQRWGALIVAVLALATSVWSADAERRHKRLSVRPQLSVEYGVNDERAWWIMANTGLGPGIIHRFEVFVDDKPQANWATFARALGANDVRFEFSVPYSFENVIAGGTAPLFVVYKKEYPAAYDQIKNNWERVRMEVCYCSLYDECAQAASKRPSPARVSRRSVASCELPKLGETT